mgnify:FL=1
MLNVKDEEDEEEPPKHQNIEKEQENQNANNEIEAQNVPSSLPYIGEGRLKMSLLKNERRIK